MRRNCVRRVTNIVVVSLMARGGKLGKLKFKFLTRSSNTYCH